MRRFSRLPEERTLFQIVIVGVMAWMALADLALGGIKFIFPSLYAFYKEAWIDNLDKLTLWQRHLLFFFYFAALLLAGAIVIAAV
jgi:hypothetical protein